jgi:ubiquinone/menaquinone biosynthesis C-methylase UbiE
MNLSKYRCVACNEGQLRAHNTGWQCEHCEQTYSTIGGVPRLYLEKAVGERDRKLRDFFYNGFLGKYYQHVMPFLALPVRPNYWNGWLVYGVILAALLSLIAYVLNFFFFAHRLSSPTLLDISAIVVLAAVLFFLMRQRYLLYLFLLAIPVKLSLLSNRFRADETFPQVHADLVGELSQRQGKLELLDVSTGTCNSLYRHGWMKLNANYTGLDLSETMLLHGLKLMSQRGVLMDFVLADAARLPFAADQFDIVTNYGALNGYSDAGTALKEMARVARSGALVLFFDEQLYEGASWVEKVYFHRVLSSHDVIHKCPIEQIPGDLRDVKVRQIYHFYYLCTGYKK